MSALHAAKPRRCAFYLRVSTDEQTTANQLADLETLARVRGFEIVKVYDETGSAVKRRPVYEQMLQDAKRGRFDVLLIAAIDRLGRSMNKNVQDALELDRCGVELVSHRETWLDMTSPVRGLLLAVFSWLAEEERRVLIARTKSGLARARREGRVLGRPRVVLDLGRARRLREEGRSVRAVAKVMGVSKSVLGRALAGPVPNSPPAVPPDPAAIGDES